MGISNFFSSYLGMYIAQSVCHSLTAAIIVDRSINAWKIKSPLMRQRFRYMVVILPLFLFPVYQMLNPDRGSVAFRLEALFDINRWLNMELWKGLQLNMIFILILTVTALITFFQEIIPVLRHTLETRRSQDGWDRPESNSIIYRALDGLSGERPDIFVMDNDDFILFSTAGENGAIFLSTGVIDTLNLEQLRAALAHEIAHIKSSRRPIIIMLFFLRVLMFFNPVVLVEFRRIVQEDEHICDNMAVSLTRNPSALAETLSKLYHIGESVSPVSILKPSKLKASLEEYSHNILIENRIQRLNNGIEEETDSQWGRLAVTLITIIILNYFVV